MTYHGKRLFANSILLELLTFVESGKDWFKFAKKVMIAILDNRNLTDEVLNTTMCLVEQTLNARHLIAVSDDP